MIRAEIIESQMSKITQSKIVVHKILRQSYSNYGNDIPPPVYLTTLGMASHTSEYIVSTILIWLLHCLKVLKWSVLGFPRFLYYMVVPTTSTNMEFKLFTLLYALLQQKALPRTQTLQDWSDDIRIGGLTIHAPANGCGWNPDTTWGYNWNKWIIAGESQPWQVLSLDPGLPSYLDNGSPVGIYGTWQSMPLPCLRSIFLKYDTVKNDSNTSRTIEDNSRRADNDSVIVAGAATCNENNHIPTSLVFSSSSRPSPASTSYTPLICSRVLRMVSRNH